MTVTSWQEKLLEKLNLDGLSNWTPRNVAAARELILTFHDIFVLDRNELGCMSAIEQEIHINDSEPFKEQFRHIPTPLLEEVCASLRDMLDVGVICPSQSLWYNVVVLVWKKDGTLYFCVDFHRLNAHTKKDSYPLPQIQEALESMAGVMHFSMMDFKSRFWQVKMVPESQQYTTFTVGNLGFYEFTCMPFGLCNVPATFQCLMQNTLGELNLTYCIIYLDDVIVLSCMEEEHLECICVMFEQFCKFNLKLKPSKCSFFQSEIVYLVHHVFHEGIHPSKENVYMVEEFPMPETFTQVHAFCRLVGHYRHFIKGFAHIARPLYNVLGKEVKMGPVQLPPEAWEVVRILKDPLPCWCSPTLTDHSSLRLMPPRRGWVLCCFRSRMTGATTLLHLGAIPSCHQRKTTTALNLSSLPSSGVSLSTSKSTSQMHCLWYRLTTIC